MPTKLDQSQVDGLPEEIQSLDSIDVSLEVKISTEDSQNDQVDINLQGQIDDLKNAMLSLIFGSRLDVMVNETSITALVPTQYPIPVTSTSWAWYYNNDPIVGAIYSYYTPTESGEYKASVTFTTQLGYKTIESDLITFEMSK